MANQSSVKNTIENNEALNFASVDQELNGIRQGKKKKNFFVGSQYAVRPLHHFLYGVLLD